MLQRLFLPSSCMFCSMLFKIAALFFYVFCRAMLCKSGICCHTVSVCPPPPLPPLWPHLRCDVGLEEEEYWKKNCICVTVRVCTIILVHKGMSSSYRLVDCVGLWSCLVLLCLPSTSVSLVFIVLLKIFAYNLLLTFYGAEPGSWLTSGLQCCDTVGWVIWPVKSSPIWPIMCRVGR